MKYSLIGCGRISDKHINAAIENDLNIVSLCDVDLEKCKNQKNKYNLVKTNCYDNINQMILSENPDIIAIATPSGSHFNHAKICINNYCHTIIEKPMAMSIEECCELIKLAKKNNVLITICHQNRFNQATQKAYEIIKNGDIGKILYISGNLRWSRDKAYYNQAQWRGKWQTDGGVLMNQGIHFLDMILWLIGNEILSITALMDNLEHDYIEVEDTAFAIIKFKNGQYAVIEATTCIYNKNLEETICIVATKGTIKICGKSLNDIYLNDNLLFKVTTDNYDIYGQGHILLYKDMINAIQNRKAPLITGNDGKKAVEFVLGIYKSSKINRQLYFPISNIKSSDFKELFNEK